ncbi:MAG: hypothetical protein M1815_001931 [Lichina confinis]|nr:MAG: hypothetical protein M1815_001931 [Lichina confinis]
MALVHHADHPSQPQDGTVPLDGNDKGPRDCLSDLFDQFLVTEQTLPDQDILEEYCLVGGSTLFSLDNPFFYHASADALLFSSSATRSDCNGLSSPLVDAAPFAATNASIQPPSPLRRANDDPSLSQSLVGIAAAALKRSSSGTNGSPVIGQSVFPATPPLTPSTSRMTKPHSTPTVDKKKASWRKPSQKRCAKQNLVASSSDASHANETNTGPATPGSRQQGFDRGATASGLVPPRNDLPLSPPPSGKAPSEGFPTTLKVPQRNQPRKPKLPFRTINWHVDSPTSRTVCETPAVGYGSFQPAYSSFDGMVATPSPHTGRPLGVQDLWGSKEPVGSYDPNPNVPVAAMSTGSYLQQAPTPQSTWWNGHGHGSPSMRPAAAMNNVHLRDASQRVIDVTSSDGGVAQRQSLGLGAGDMASTLAMEGLMISCGDPMVSVPEVDHDMRNAMGNDGEVRLDDNDHKGFAFNEAALWSGSPPMPGLPPDSHTEDGGMSFGTDNVAASNEPYPVSSVAEGLSPTPSPPTSPSPFALRPRNKRQPSQPTKPRRASAPQTRRTRRRATQPDLESNTDADATADGLGVSGTALGLTAATSAMMIPTSSPGPDSTAASSVSTAHPSSGPTSSAPSLTAAAVTTGVRKTSRARGGRRVGSTASTKIVRTARRTRSTPSALQGTAGASAGRRRVGAAAATAAARGAGAAGRGRGRPRRAASTSTAASRRGVRRRVGGGAGKTVPGNSSSSSSSSSSTTSAPAAFFSGEPQRLQSPTTAATVASSFGMTGNDAGFSLQDSPSVTSSSFSPRYTRHGDLSAFIPPPGTVNPLLTTNSLSSPFVPWTSPFSSPYLPMTSESMLAPTALDDMSNTAGPYGMASSSTLSTGATLPHTTTISSSPFTQESLGPYSHTSNMLFSPSSSSHQRRHHPPTLLPYETSSSNNNSNDDKTATAPTAPTAKTSMTPTTQTTSSAVDFVNFTASDRTKLLGGVAPSGSSKTKARRDREAVDRRRKLSVAAFRAVQAAGGDVELLKTETGLLI